MADTLNRSQYQSTLGIRLVDESQFADYTRRFLHEGRGLSSTLYEVPSYEMRDVYKRPGSSAIINSLVDSPQELRQVSRFKSRSHDVSTYSQDKLHFKSHVAQIEGQTKAYIPTGNLSYYSLKTDPIPRSESARKRESHYVGQYQINLGLEISNPSIVREVKQIQHSLKTGRYIQRTEHFLDGSSATKDLGSQLRKAGKGDEVVLVSPYLDNMKVVRDIARASLAGAKVTVIAAAPPAVNSPSVEASRSTAKEYLAAAGVNVYTSDESLLVHAKYAAITGKGNKSYFQLGSSNYTYASQRGETLDYMFAANDPAIAAQLIQQTHHIKEVYGLTQVSKSPHLNINKHDLGPLSTLYRPAFKTQGRIPSDYERNLGKENFVFGQLPYYPTSMPSEYFQLFQGRALPEVSIYQNLYEAYTRQEAPQALKAMDKALSNPGLGENINRLLGINLYSPGDGIGLSLLKGTGRLLDTIFGHYQYQEHKRQMAGDNRGTLAKQDDLIYQDLSSPTAHPPGFFEQSFGFVGESIQAVGLSLASYFAIGHTWNVFRSHAQDVGVDFIFDENNSSPLSKFARDQYTTPAVQQLTSKASSITQRVRTARKQPTAATLDDILAARFFDGLSDELIGSKAIHSSIEALRDYALLGVDNTDALSPQSLNKAKSLDLFRSSHLSQLLQDKSFIDDLNKAGISTESLQLDDLIQSYARTFTTYNPTYSAMAELIKPDPSKISTSLENLTGESLPTTTTKAIKSHYTSGLKRLGIDLDAGRMEMKQLPLGNAGFTGFFGLMAGSRNSERAIFDAVTRPMLEYVAVVGNNQHQNFSKSLAHLSEQISTPPVLQFMKKVSNGDSSFHEFIKLSHSHYGYHRMESIAEAYENIAYFIPSNLLLWFKPIRDLLGVQSIATAGTPPSIEPNSGMSPAEKAAATADLHQRLAGQSLKGLVGSGFKGLVATQKAVSHTLIQLSKSPVSSFSTAYNLLTNDFHLRVIEDQLRGSTNSTILKAAKEAKLASSAAEAKYNSTNNIINSLRNITESLYQSSQNLEGELLAKLQLRHRSLKLASLKDKPALALSSFRYIRNKQFSQARRTSSELFQMHVFEDYQLGEKYTSLIKEQESLSKSAFRIDTIDEISTAKSAPFQMFRRFMMGAGLFFAADYIIDRFFLQTPGADLITQLLADSQLSDEDGDRLADMKFEGRMPASVKYPLALAGFLAGGIVFGETKLKDTVVSQSINALRPALDTQARLLSQSISSPIPKDITQKLDSPLLAKLFDQMPSRRVSRHFGMTGALVGMAAALFASQTLFSTIAHVANNIMGRNHDGLSIGGMNAQFSTTLMNAAAEAIEARENNPRTTRINQADISLGIMTAAQFQQSGQSIPGRSIFSYSYQLTTPIFQVALVQRHESSTGVTTIGAGFQFLPVLGMGTTPALPLSFKLRTKPSDFSSATTLALLKEQGFEINPEAEALAKQFAPPHPAIQIFNYLSTGGFGDSLDYNPKSSMAAAMLFLGSSGILVDSARHIGKHLPQGSPLRREIKNLGVFADVPYHSLRLMNRLVEFSQMPLLLIPDTLKKGITAFSSTGPTYANAVKGTGRTIGAMMAFFATKQLVSNTIESFVGSDPQYQQASNLVAFPVALLAAKASYNTLGSIKSGGSISRKMPTFLRRAAPYYLSYLVSQSIVSPDSQIAQGLESHSIRSYSNVALAAMYGYALDQAGVFRRYDDKRLTQLGRNPVYSTQAKRLRHSSIQEAANSGMRSQVQEAKAWARDQTAALLKDFDEPIESFTFNSAARSKARELYKGKLDDILRKSTNNMSLLKTLGSRMGLAARTLFTLRLAATVITSLAPNSLRGSAIMAPFRIMSGVEPYQDEAQPARDPLAIMLGKYKPRNVREAFGSMLDFIGQSLTFGKFSPAQAMGLFKDQPNMFLPLAAGAGVTVGSNDQLRTYTQAQGVSVDASLAIYSIFRGQLSADLALQLQSVLVSKKGADLSSILSYYRGAFARRDPAKTSSFLVGSQTDAAGGSRGLMMAQRIRNHTMVNLANQRPSEIAFDFMRMMIGAGYASDENVDLKRIKGLPINYLGSLIFDTPSNSPAGKTHTSLIKNIVGGSATPDLTDYIITSALSNNIQLADRVPVLGDFIEAAAVFSKSQQSPDPSTQFLSAATFAAITAPAVMMLAMTGTELIAAFAAMSKGGSQNLARKDLDDTLNSIRSRYSYNRKIRKHGSRHRFSTGLAGFVDVSIDAVIDQQARARELFFIMERQDSTRAARIDLRGLDLQEHSTTKISSLFNRQYIGSKQSPGVLTSIVSFLDDQTGVDVHNYLIKHKTARAAATALYSDFKMKAFDKLSENIGFSNLTLVKAFGFDDYDSLINTIFDKQEVVDKLTYLFDPNDLMQSQQYKPGDLVERSVFVRKYLSEQAEEAINKLEGTLPHYSKDQIEDIIGQPGIVTKIRQDLNSQILESGSAVTTLRKNADEIAFSSAANLIRKQGVVATVRDAASGAGSAFMKLTQLSEVYSMAEAISMLGSDKLVERRMASYAVATYATEIPLALAGMAALRYALSNPLIAIGVAAIGIGIMSHTQLMQNGAIKKLGQGISNLERTFVDKLSSLTYAASNLPIIQPALSTITAPLRAILHNVISPTFTSMRMGASENTVLNYLTQFFVPETLDTFVDRPRFQSLGYTHTGPIQELYTPSQIKNATRTRLANKRSRISQLGSYNEEELVHPFLQGRASGYRERLIQEKLFANTTLSAFASGAGYSISPTLQLALNRRQAMLDMTVYGRYTQRPDESFPSLGGDIAMMNAAFKANRVGGGSPFALNKVIEEMRALFGTPMFRGLGKVFNLMLDYSDTLTNKALEFLDFRGANNKGDFGERIFKFLSSKSGKTLDGIYNTLSEDAPKLTSFISGVYNRGMWQVLKTLGPKGLISQSLGITKELISLSTRNLIPKSLITKMGGFHSPQINILAGRKYARKLTGADYTKSGIGILAGLYIGSSIGAGLGGESFGQAGAIAGSLIGAGIGVAAMYPVSSLKALANLAQSTEEFASNFSNQIQFIQNLKAQSYSQPQNIPPSRLPRFLNPQSISNIPSVSQSLNQLADFSQSIINKGQYIRNSLSNKSAILKSHITAKSLKASSFIKETSRRVAPAIFDGLPSIIDVANLIGTSARVISLKGTDARRDYDSAYKGIAQASVTISVASLSSAFMRGKFAPLKIIALSALANNLIGKPLGELLSEKAYSSLLESNQGKRFYSRKNRPLSALDVLVGTLGAAATLTIATEFATTQTGRKTLAFGARQLARTPAGGSLLMRIAQTSQSTQLAFSSLDSALSNTASNIKESLFSRNSSRTISSTPTGFVAGETAEAITSPAASSSNQSRSLLSRFTQTGAGRFVGKALNLLGYGAMFVLPALAGFSQLNALNKMSGDSYKKRDLRSDYQDIFAGPMREGLGLLGAAAGSALGPIGTLVGGVAGSLLGDIIGQSMSERNYKRLHEAGLTSKRDIRKVAEATRTGSIIGAAGGLILGLGAAALTVAAVTVSLPALALGALATMVVGGVTLLGSAIGAQVGFDTGLSNAKKDKHGGTNPTDRRTYNARTRQFRSTERTARTRSRSIASANQPHNDRQASNLHPHRNRTNRAIIQNYRKDQKPITTPPRADREVSNTDSMLFVADSKSKQNIPSVNLMSALPPISKRNQHKDEVDKEQRLKLHALKSEMLLIPKSSRESYNNEATVNDIRITQAPQPWWKRLLEAPKRMFESFKMAATGALNKVKELVSGIGDIFKKAVDSLMGGAAQAATPAGGNELTNKIQSRIQSTVPALFQAVGLQPPSVVGNVDAGQFGGVNLNAEQVGHAATIIRVGRQVGASDRDIQIALMTAMQESTLRNLNYGDDWWLGQSDSKGLFQQRTTMGWGTEAQVQNPEYAARTFFLGSAAGNQGLLDNPNRNNLSMAAAAQWVQRSAFPDHYAKHESMARDLFRHLTTPTSSSSQSNTRQTGEINIRSLAGILREDMGMVRETVRSIQQQQSSAVTGGAFATGLYTGPAHLIGGSSAYHIDMRFMVGTMSLDEMVAATDAVAAGYRARGRKMEFSNSAVSGLVYDERAPIEQRRSLLQRAISAHSSRAGRAPIDFYIPLISGNRFDSSSEGAEILAPTFPGGRAEYASESSGAGAYVNLYNAQGTLVAQVMHGDISRAPGSSANRTFSSQSTTPSQQSQTPQSYDQAYQQAMGTMDGSHYIGQRFEDRIIQRLKEAGIPQSRIDQVRQEIRRFNESLPESERQRAQQLIRQGRDPNYFDRLPVDNLFEARDAATNNRLPREVRSQVEGGGPQARAQSLEESERENINAAARSVDPEVARTQRQTNSYSLASAATATRQAAQQQPPTPINISRPSGPHPDNLVALAEPNSAPSSSPSTGFAAGGQQEVQRLASSSTSLDATGNPTTHLIITSIPSEADRATVAANGQRLPSTQLLLSEPIMVS